MSDEIKEQQVAPAAPQEAATAPVPAPAPAPADDNQLPPPPAEIIIPKDDGAPATKKVEESKQTVKITVSDKGKKDAKKAKKPNRAQTLKEEWDRKLLSVGNFSNSVFRSVVTTYASTHHGYTVGHKWGSCLISMTCRLAQRMRDRIETFDLEMAEYIGMKVLEFLQNKPLGANPIVWNTNFKSNLEQRNHCTTFWGIDKRLEDLEPRDQALKMVVEAAWPTEFETKEGLGGSYAERLHYLLYFLVNLITAYDQADEHFWKPMTHDKPTELYLTKYNKKLGRGGPKKDFPPSWVVNGHCKACGSEVITDPETGVLICSSLSCDHNIPVVGGELPDSFKDPSSAGRPTPGEAPKPPRREKGDRRHNRDDEDTRGFERKNHKKGKKFRVRDDDGDELPPPSSQESAPVYSSGEPQGGFGSGAFDALSGIQV